MKRAKQKASKRKGNELEGRMTSSDGIALAKAQGASRAEITDRSHGELEDAAGLLTARLADEAEGLRAQLLSHEAYVAALHEDIAHFIEEFRAVRRRELDMERQCKELTAERDQLRRDIRATADQRDALERQLGELSAIAKASGLSESNLADWLLAIVGNADRAHRELNQVYSSRSWRYTSFVRRGGQSKPHIGTAKSGQQLEAADE